MTIEVEDSKPPEWMIALENKQKRHHKLAHEIGAGAPCLNCNDGCAGLDLHFWRKICRNCKCKKEEHNVKEENSFEHFEILFGDNLKTSDRVKKLSLDLKFKLKNIPIGKDVQGKDSAAVKAENDLLFDWIPADIPVNLASEYLQQLPLEKLPITGSAGAIFRRQQLQKQIPLHDFKINDCHDLTEEETVAFTEYVDNLKTHAVGKGQITKVPSNQEIPIDKYLKPLILSTNLNSSPKPFRSLVDTQSSVAEVNNLPFETTEFPSSSLVDLKTPSAFILSRKPINSCSPALGITNNNLPPSTPKSTYDKCIESSKPIAELTVQYSEKLNFDEKNISEELAFNTDSSDRTNVGDNQDLQNNHWCANDDKLEVEPSKLRPSEIIRKLNANPKAEKSTTSLTGTSSMKNVDGKFMKITNPVEEFLAVSSYVSNEPQHSNVFAGVARKTNRNLKTHLESPDNVESESQKCPCPISSDFVVSDVEFSMLCHQCKHDIIPGQVVVVAERADMKDIWHPQCFVCVICQELLVDLVYFFHRGDVYCGRHYAEVLRIPRCFACDELIFLKEYTVAESQTFHVKHFCCFECDEPLAGKQYVPKDNNPVCLPCYEEKYGKECHFCEQMIKAGDSRVGWHDLSWHATESCFKCTQCYKSLLGGRFVVRDQNPLCSKECVARFVEQRGRS